jgi:hypothetical protein
MKKVCYFLLTTLPLLCILSCNKDTFNDLSLVQTGSTPAKLSAFFDITQNNSGLVTITPNGEGGAVYDVYFGDATTTPAKVMPGKSVQHTYAEGVYNVKIIAHGITGKLTESTQKLTVSFKAPEAFEVTAAADPTSIFKYNVSAKALYETMFKVYFGDATNEVPQSFLEGETISHTYAKVGTYTIRVIAYSGGAASTEFSKTITIVDPVVLPIDFESASVQYNFGNFDGGNTSVVSNPQVKGINLSSKVAKMIKNAGQTWGGSSIALGGSIDFSANKIFRMKIFSPRAGAKVLLKVENAANSSLSFEKEVATTLVNTWEDLAFDFRAINTANTYQNIVVIIDNGTMGDGSGNFTFLLDDIRLTNTLPASVPINLPVTFDDGNVNYTVTDFGNTLTVDATDPTNAGNFVKKTTKLPGAETWAGTTIGTNKGFSSAIPIAANATKMSIRVYAPAAGIRVRLKIEDHNNNAKSVETEAVTTKANAWETLVFDFANQAAGTAALNLSYTYDMASVFFDFNTSGNGKVYYWDDVQMVTGSVTPGGIALPLDFESTTLTYAFTDFNGGNATVINNTQKSGINNSNQVVRMIKNADQPWGGSWLGLTSPINFSTKKTFKMKVFSPRVGAKVLLKVENQTNGSINFEKETTTTKANTWEELTFDYSAIDVSKQYQKIVVIFDNGTMGDGSANFTFLFDDINLY